MYTHNIFKYVKYCKHYLKEATIIFTSNKLVVTIILAHKIL